MLDKKIILTNKYCEEEINNLSKQIGVSPLLIDILLKEVSAILRQSKPSYTAAQSLFMTRSF